MAHNYSQGSDNYGSNTSRKTEKENSVDGSTCVPQYEREPTVPTIEEKMHDGLCAEATNDVVLR